MLFSFNTKAGIQKDGTLFSSSYYTDGEWTRFYQGKPYKMGGYKSILAGTSERIVNLYTIPQQTEFDLYLGRPSSISFVRYNSSLIPSVENDRTPGAFVANDDNSWTFDKLTQIGTPFDTFLLAHAAPNNNDIASTETQPVWYGDVLDNTPLLNTTIEVSGGVVVLGDYALAYGNNGVVFQSNRGDPTTWNDHFIIGATKIVKGYPIRSGGTPAGLFWALDGVYRSVYNSTAGVFLTETLQRGSSVLSAQSVVEANNLIFWIGQDNFYVYNGVIQALPNEINKEWFFANLNRNEKEKCWGIHLPQFFEIMWHFPSGDNTFPDQAIGYNYLQNFWFNTAWGRTAGVFSHLVPYPLMSDTFLERDLGDTERYGVWAHEFGTSKQINGNEIAIPSWIRTNMLHSGLITQEEMRAIQLSKIYLDRVQTGQMFLEVESRAYPTSTSSISSPVFFNPTEPKLDLREQGNFIMLKFTSNDKSGSFELGTPILDIQIGDKKPTPVI